MATNNHPMDASDYAGQAASASAGTNLPVKLVEDDADFWIRVELGITAQSVCNAFVPVVEDGWK